ncbi:MAG: hypothetical protein FJZ78_00405 [Bacteroidetes bacterium]|nr:hypothetical protein [Bacteroidota bacterium]
MNFQEYLESKKIDAVAFSREASDLFASWKSEFEQVHPSSFTSRHLYQINSIRRKFKLTAPVTPATHLAARPKPIMKPKMN